MGVSVHISADVSGLNVNLSGVREIASAGELRYEIPLLQSNSMELLRNSCGSGAPQMDIYRVLETESHIVIERQSNLRIKHKGVISNGRGLTSVVVEMGKAQSTSWLQNPSLNDFLFGYEKFDSLAAGMIEKGAIVDLKPLFKQPPVNRMTEPEALLEFRVSISGETAFVHPSHAKAIIEEVLNENPEVHTLGQIVSSDFVSEDWRSIRDFQNSSEARLSVGFQ